MALIRFYALGLKAPILILRVPQRADQVDQDLALAEVTTALLEASWGNQQGPDERAATYQDVTEGTITVYDN